MALVTFLGLHFIFVYKNHSLSKEIFHLPVEVVVYLGFPFTAVCHICLQSDSSSYNRLQYWFYIIEFQIIRKLSMWSKVDAHVIRYVNTTMSV